MNHVYNQFNGNVQEITNSKKGKGSGKLELWVHQSDIKNMMWF